MSNGLVRALPGGACLVSWRVYYDIYDRDKVLNVAEKSTGTDI